MHTTIRRTVLSFGLAALAVVMAAGNAAAATSGTDRHAAGPVSTSFSSAARSVKTTFFNDSDCTLTNYDAWLYHGIWTIYPPTIPPHTTVVFGSESSGLFTGTEGYVRYMADPYCIPGPVGTYMYWNNPYVGSNSYDSSRDGDWFWKLTRSGSGTGNNASMSYRLTG